MVKYKITKGLITQKLDEKTVVFDGEKSILYTLNRTATDIFKLLKKGLEKKEIIEKMVKKYKIKPERIEKDVNELISDLKQKKILKFASRQPKK